MASALPRIAITPGEPAGIGPDLCVRLAQTSHLAELVAVGSRQVLHERAHRLGLPLKTRPYTGATVKAIQQPGELVVLDIPTASPVRCGVLDTENADYVLETLVRATNGCLDGEFRAMVTGPVHKGVINDAGTPFSGHTEYLAELCQSEPLMMLACPKLRVALVTTHLPLAEVAAAVTMVRVEQAARILHEDLVDRFGIAEPRILVTGLNPHAGEDGHLGKEEIRVIEPALARLRAQGMNLEGPLPADSLFTPRMLEGADAVLTMYHDQGLPVLKHACFGRAVNITLGLPIIRTSVDHGTALDLAGTGAGDSDSFEAAIAMAIQLSGDSRHRG